MEELFDPKDETNKKTTNLTMEFGKIAAQAWLDEFRKKGNGKNTFKYLQSTDGELAFDKFNAEELEKFINLLANNNPSEEAWGIASAEYFGKTSILGGNTAAIAMSKYNKPFHIDHKNPNNNGWFHKLPKELQTSLLAMALHLWNLIRAQERQKIDSQKEYKKMEHEGKIAAKIIGASEAYKKRVVLLHRYKSDFPWKTGSEARAVFHSLSTDGKRLKAVKDQIQMRTIGCGWKHLHTNWQVNNVKKTASELLEYFIDTVLVYENSQDATVPTISSLKLPSRQQ